MAIKDIICRGVGFIPGSVKFMPTHGFITNTAIQLAIVQPPSIFLWDEWGWLDL